MIKVADISVGKKLFLGFALVILVLGAVAMYQVYSMSKLATLQDAGARRSVEAQEVIATSSRLAAVYAVMADGIINRNLDETVQGLDEIRVYSSKDIEAIRAMADTSEEKAWAQEFADLYKKYISTYEDVALPILKRYDALSTAKGDTVTFDPADEARLREVDGKVDGIRDDATEVLDSFVLSIREEANKADAEYDEINQRTVFVSMVLLGLGILVAIVMATFIARAITQPLLLAVEALDRMAEGDLTVKVEPNGTDEPNQMLAAMKDMVKNLRKIATQTLSASNQVAAASDQLSDANQSFSERITEQAASVEETSSAMEETSSTIEEISVTIKQTAENAREMNKLAQATKGFAEDGSKAMGETIVAIEEINRASDKITSISNVIEEIAFQTNLLALNAAVEAARAGEHGKGFAVVATEIRSLAQRTKESAKEINDLIADGVDKSERGVALARTTSKTLEDMGTSLKKVTDLIDEVAAATNEQNQGTHQINKGVSQVTSAMSQIEQAAQHNAALVEEASQASEELSAQAQSLKKLVSFFKLGSRDDDAIVDEGYGSRRALQQKHKIAFAGSAPKGKAPAAKTRKPVNRNDDEDDDTGKAAEGEFGEF